MTEIELAPKYEIYQTKPADKHLSEKVTELIIDSTPPNTRRAHKRQWKQFEEWCNHVGRSALPATPETMATYVTYLTELDLGDISIEQAIGVIRVKHRLTGVYEPPDAEMSLKILRGHRRNQSENGRQPKQAPPLTKRHLKKMLDVCPKDTLQGIRDRLLLVLGYSLAARRSELSELRMENLEITERQINVLIRKSKTDKQSKGVIVPVPVGDGSEDSVLSCLAKWAQAIHKVGEDPQTGYVFRAITKHGTFYHKQKLSPETINKIIKRLAISAEIPNADKFSAHSLRAGFATQATQDGIPMAIWSRHGRWQPTSAIPASYVRRQDAITDNPLNIIGF